MLWKFKDAWLFFCAGRAHCAMHREGAMEYGLIRTNTDEYGRGFGSLTAMRSRNSKVHGTQYAMYSPLRTTPYTSVPIRTRLRFATPWQAGIARSIGSAQCAPPANSPPASEKNTAHLSEYSVFFVLIQLKCRIPLRGTKSA